MRADSNGGIERPTDKVSDEKRVDREGGWTRHFWYWVAIGPIAAQFQIRVWRFTWQVTFWRVYDL